MRRWSKRPNRRTSRSVHSTNRGLEPGFRVNYRDASRRGLSLPGGNGSRLTSVPPAFMALTGWRNMPFALRHDIRRGACDKQDD